jgi:hypothetical protein
VTTTGSGRERDVKERINVSDIPGSLNEQLMAVDVYTFPVAALEPLWGRDGLGYWRDASVTGGTHATSHIGK